MKDFSRFNCWLLAILLTVTWPPPAAVAQSISMIPIPDENAIVCDENHNSQADLEGDTWVFDQNSDGKAELIIVFRSEGHGTAYIYDDAGANAQVDYDVTDTGIQVLEPYWRIKVERRHGSWYLPDGDPDWNLDIVVDSSFRKAGSEPRFELLDNLAADRQGRSAIDGATDFTVRYWDTDRDGTPDYEYNDVRPGGVRHDVWVINKNVHLQIQPTYRFPLLETVLKMDWQQARVTRVQHLIPTRTNEAGYFLYFNRPTHDDKINSAWENPFAFYDLHGDHDGVSELKLRAVTEDYDRQRRNVAVYNEIRYSWAQTGNDPEYRLYLIGQVLSTKVNQYPLYSISHTAYEDLPSFVLEKVWEAAAFAEYETDKPGAFGEGIYENFFFASILRDWLLSHRDVTLPRYLPMFLQLREEYNFTDYQRQPRLYFSPIDKRLHLVGSQQGIIIFSAHSTGVSSSFAFTDAELEEGNLLIESGVTYADTDNDGYVDLWTYLKDDQSVARLIFRHGAVLFATESSIAIKRLPTDLGPSLWEDLPPATPSEWQTFQDRLAPIAEARRPMDDLEGMFADLPGDPIFLTATALGAVSKQPGKLIARVTTAGFPVPLQPSILTSLEQPVIAGNYILEDRNDGFWLDQLTPPQVQISPITFSPISDHAWDEVSGVIEFSAHNVGSWDADPIKVLVQEHSSEGLTTVFSRTTVIPALNHTDFSIPWSPTSIGPRTILVKLRYVPVPDAGPIILQERLELYTEVPGSTLEAVYLPNKQLGVLITLIIILVVLSVTGTFRFVNEVRG